MNTFFIIGGIVVLAGITVMTVLYFRTAAELEETKTELSKARLDLKDSERAYEELWSAVMSPIADELNDIKFGGF